MERIKKLLSVLLVVAMVFTTFSMGISVSAENVSTKTNTTTNEPLEVVVTTNKSSYGKFEVANITVEIKNISDETVENISAEAIFDDLAPVDSKYSETSKKIEKLEPGESFSFSYKVTLSLNNSDVGFFSKIILWFVRLFNDGYTIIDNSSDDDKGYTEKIDVINFGRTSANNIIRLWYEYDSESIVTRGEWILKLSNVLDWENNMINLDFKQINCFNDITGNKCEKAVKYASTLGLFDNITGNFSPDSPATREFVAVTAVRALNFYETENIDCLDKSQIKHPKEVYTAVSVGLLETENNYFYPTKYLTVTQCSKVIEEISNILNSTIIDVNHENEINYTDEVIVLSDNVRYQQNGTVFEFLISVETDRLYVGCIFVLPDYTPYKVISISENGRKYIVNTEEPTMQETLNSINIEDSENVSSSTFIPADGVEVIQPRTTRSAISMENINLKIEKEVEKDITLYAELSIKNPRVEYKVDINWSKIIPHFNNVYLKFVFDTEVTGGFKSSVEGKNGPSKAGGITLGKIPVLGAFGTGIYVEIALEYSVTGKIEIVMTINGETGFQIYNNQPRGIAKLSPKFEFPSLEANAKFGPKISGLLCIVNKWDLIDFSLYAGGSAKGTLKIRDTGMSCLSAHAYVFAELQALKKGVIGKWLNLEYTWDIWNEENSCLKKELHFENLVIVPKCTYNGEDIDETALGSVSGTVKDKKTDSPIPFASVLIYLTSDKNKNKDQIKTYTCSTDKNGVFSIDLPIGRYTYEVNKFNNSNEMYYTETGAFNVEKDIETVILNPILLTRKSGNLSATVKDATTGNAISGVTVEVIDNESDDLTPITTVTTDSNGLFSIKLPYGSYSLSFNHDNYEYHGSTVNVYTENVVLTEPVLLIPKNSSGGGSDDNRTVIDSGSCGADGDNVTWTLYDDGELVISGSGAMADYYFDSSSSNFEDSKFSPWFDYSLQIKEIIITNNVTTIGDYAFAYCFYVTHINIPSNINRIGDFAFAYCCSITTVTIPESVSAIGESPFSACESLTNISVSEKNQYFSNDEYGVLYSKDKTNLIQYPMGNSHNSYLVPNGVSKIANGAFIFCDYLTEIIISDTVNSIGANAFSVCVNLSKVTIGKGVTNIEMGAFTACYDLTEIIIPENVKVIGDYAFYLTGITHVNIPDSTTTIGEYAFTNCELKTITLGKGVTVIGENAFAGNPISKISVNINNKYFLTDEFGVLYNKDKTTLIQYPCRSTYTKYTIPDSVITIKSNAFRVSDNLTEITLGNNIKTIENACFESCENLNRLVVPDSVETIGDMAFADCGITDLVLGNSVRVIGTGAFSWCDFTKLVLPESVKIIQDEAFAYNSYLVNIVIPKSVTYIGKDAFYGCNDLTSITVDENNQNYSSDDGGVLFNKKKTILIKYPNARNSTSYIIPNSVTAVADKAFYSCNNLTNIIIPDSITTIGVYAFCLCENLVEITVPNNLTSIGESVFAYCNNLKSITIPKSVTAIASQAFHSCEALTDVYYKGTSTSWNAITIEDFNNDYLKNATIHYNS